METYKYLVCFEPGDKNEDNWHFTDKQEALDFFAENKKNFKRIAFYTLEKIAVDGLLVNID